MIPKPGRDKSKVKGWRPIVLLNVVGKLADKVVAGEIMKKEELFHERAFAGRKGRGAIDSVMLMDEIRKETGGDVYGGDVKSAFNSLDRDVMRRVLHDYEDLNHWMDHFLRPRTFNVKVYGRVIGKGTMVGGTPQGTPISPTLFTVYMGRMVKEVEELMRKREKEQRHGVVTRRGKGGGREKRTFVPLSYIGDINSVRVGKSEPMDEVLEKQQETST